MNGRTEEMLNQARSAPTELLEYNKLRSNYPNTWIFSVEGKDDILFYQTICTRLNVSQEYKFLLCGGKDKVLTLHQTLIDSVSATGKIWVKFFIDHDFDGLKGFPNSHNLYCTPTYSIENLLASESVLKELLVGKFMCVGDDDADIDKIIALYKLRLNEFNNAIKNANLQLFFARKRGTKGGSIDDKLIKKFLSITLTQIKENSSCTESIEKLLGLDSEEIPPCAQLQQDFEGLDACQHWRGKFHYDFFLQFIEMLVNDRISDQPMVFTKKHNRVHFKAGESHIQEFATFIKIPTCLQEFLTCNTVKS